jgi:hypothetical protein
MRPNDVYVDLDGAGEVVVSPADMFEQLFRP